MPVMSDIKQSNKRIAKNSIFLTVRMMIVLLISLYTTRLVLRALGVEDYGVYNVVCGFVSMFTFLNLSMSNGIQRFYNYELGKNGEKGANKVYVTSLIIQAILSLAVISLVESLGLWYLHNKMVVPVNRLFAAEWIFQFSVISFLFIILQAPFSAAVMAHERMGFYSIISVLDVLLKLGIALLIPFLSGDKLIWYGALMLLINVINFLLYSIYGKTHFSEIKFTRVFEKPLFRSMLGFSGWNLFGSFSGVMQEQGINLVLNFFFGPIVNAARGVATQVNAGLEGFVTNITMPVRPQVVQSYACGNDKRMMNLTFSVSKLSCCFLMMMAIPVSVEIHYILRIWLGDNVPDHAAAFTVIILFSSLISNLNAATSNVVHATGDMKNYQFWGSIIKICSVPIAFAVLRWYPRPELALLIVFVCRLTGHIVGLYIVRSLVGLSLKQYVVKVVVPILVVIAITFCVSLPIHFSLGEGFLRLVLVSFSGVVATGTSLFFLALDTNEKRLVFQLADGLISKIKHRIHGNRQ